MSYQDALITIDKEVVSGTPVFTNTRVPVQTLFDYLANGESIENFLLDYPGVEKKQVYGLLKRSGQILINTTGILAKI